LNSLPKVAIVILNWNGQNYLSKFLPSVLATAYENKEVIVADNGSTDGSVSFLEKQFPQVKLIRFNENKGFAKGPVFLPANRSLRSRLEYPGRIAR